MPRRSPIAGLGRDPNVRALKLLFLFSSVSGCVGESVCVLSVCANSNSTLEEGNETKNKKKKKEGYDLSTSKTPVQ